MIDYEFPIDDISYVKTYDYAAIKEAFDYVVKESKLTFDFPQGGCQQRSHMISIILSKKFNLHHFKIWLFSPAALFDYDERTFFVPDLNKLSPNDLVHWNYHTAPAVRYFDGKEYQIVIFDPSIDKKEPVLLKNWLGKIGNSHEGKYTFLYPEKYFFNCKYNDYSQLTNVFDGTFFEFINPAKDNLVMEKGLAVNDMAMTIYKKHIKKKVDQKDDDLELQDLKDIFGNATALDLLFAQNLSGNTDNTSYRYVLGKYPEIIKEAKVVFHERLLYWTAFVNNLLKEDYSTTNSY
jgi:hypothetical protein